MQSTSRRLAPAETWASNKETASRIRIQIAQEVYDEYRFNIRGSQGSRSAQH